MRYVPIRDDVIGLGRCTVDFPVEVAVVVADADAVAAVVGAHHVDGAGVARNLQLLAFARITGPTCTPRETSVRMYELRLLTSYCCVCGSVVCEKRGVEGPCGMQTVRAGRERERASGRSNSNEN